MRELHESEVGHYTLIEPAKIVKHSDEYHITRQRKLKVNQEVYDYPRDYINIYEIEYRSPFYWSVKFIKQDWVPAVVFKDVNYSDVELLYKLENVGYLKRKKVSVALAEELTEQPTQPTQPIEVATPTTPTPQPTQPTQPIVVATPTTPTTTATSTTTTTDTFKKYLPYIIIGAIIVIVLILFKKK